MKKKIMLYQSILVTLGILCVFMLAFTLLSGSLWLCIPLALVLGASGFVVYRLYKITTEMESFLKKLGGILAPLEQKTITGFPFPIVVADKDQKVIWYNEAAAEQMFKEEEVFSKDTKDLFPNVSFEESCPPQGYHVDFNDKMFTAYTVLVTEKEETYHVLYLMDDTRLKKLAREYYLSKPAIAIIAIDNYDELLQNARENERSQLMSRIEKIIEEFALDNKGLIRRLEKDKFLAVIEERYMKTIIERRFAILDEVRKVVTTNNIPATLSIGIGREAKHFSHGEEMARQALDMALGRGGDQAAIKNRSGYEFYGGVSKGIEKHTKVKTRIVATAMVKLMQGCDNILIMGHRFADLDCLGAAVGLYGAAQKMGKPATIVIDEEKNLAKPLYYKLKENGFGDAFIEPAHAKELIGKNTLLIIVDTHIPHILESEEVYKACQNVVIVDHHRKMVDYIDNAVIFFHEPYASSTAEMVTELIQYFGDYPKMSSMEAEALLSGIMLDTKNFVIRTGVRTFEAAAYLRRMGADTVEVRRLFSSTMESYQKRSRLVAAAEVYKRCAIAYTNDSTGEIKIVAPQAADELLNINDVDASFVMFEYEGGVSYCARSMGQINVQVIMERIGGGGHHTMAGAQLQGITIEDARQNLLEAIDEYYANNQ